MRWIIIAIVCAAAVASAKPKVGVMPLAGDLPGGKLTAAVAEALGDDFNVLSAKSVAKAAGKKSGVLDDDEAKSVERELSAVAIVHGKVNKDGKKKSLELKISVKGQDTAELVVRLKGTTLDDNGKTKIHDEVQKGIAANEDKPKPLQKSREEKKEEKREAREEKREEAKEEKKKRTASEEDEETTKVRKRRRRDEADAGPRATKDIFLDAGAAYGMRRLTYDSTSPTPPPTVSTAAPSGRVEAEIYMKAAGATGGLANLGFAGEFDKAFLVTIKIGQATVPIDQGHYAAGVRYRMNVGAASVLVIAADFANRHYIADRSGLTAASQLDAPDVDYMMAQAGAGIRTPFTPTITGFAKLLLMLPFKAGPIEKSDSYGAGTLFGAYLNAGADIMVANGVALHIAGEYDQLNFSFNGKGGMAQGRQVTAATDRQLGIVATLGLTY